MAVYVTEMIDGEVVWNKDLLFRMEIIRQMATAAAKVKREIQTMRLDERERMAGEISDANLTLNLYNKINKAKKKLKDYLDDEYYAFYEFEEFTESDKRYGVMMTEIDRLMKEVVWSVFSMEEIMDREGLI